MNALSVLVLSGVNVKNDNVEEVAKQIVDFYYSQSVGNDLDYAILEDMQYYDYGPDWDEMVLYGYGGLCDLSKEEKLEDYIIPIVKCQGYKSWRSKTEEERVQWLRKKFRLLFGEY